MATLTIEIKGSDHEFLQRCEWPFGGTAPFLTVTLAPADELRIKIDTGRIGFVEFGSNDLGIDPGESDATSLLFRWTQAAQDSNDWPEDVEVAIDRIHPETATPDTVVLTIKMDHQAGITVESNGSEDAGLPESEEIESAGGDDHRALFVVDRNSYGNRDMPQSEAGNAARKRQFSSGIGFIDRYGARMACIAGFVICCLAAISMPTHWAWIFPPLFVWAAFRAEPNTTFLIKLIMAVAAGLFLLLTYVMPHWGAAFFLLMEVSLVWLYVSAADLTDWTCSQKYTFFQE